MSPLGREAAVYMIHPKQFSRLVANTTRRVLRLAGCMYCVADGVSVGRMSTSLPESGGKGKPQKHERALAIGFG
jgi:uncharacterized protein (DUF2062 family)